MSESFKSSVKRFLHDDKITGFDVHRQFMASNEDIEHCISKNRVLEKARKNGGQDLPTESSQRLDSVEQEIVFHFRGLANAKYNNFKEIKDAFDNQINLVDVSSNSNAASKIADNFKENLNLKIQSATDSLKQIRQLVEERRQDLKNFKVENDLNRSARYPESHLTSVAILSFILIAEVLLNGYFFAQDSDFGLLGGGIQALIFAFLNILACFLLARLVTLLNHLSGTRRLLGWASLTLLATWLVLYNLMVAHYRDALMVQDVDVAVSLVDRLMVLGIDFQDSNSLFLWLLGIVFGGVAAWEGYRWDDPYPGYGRLARALRSAEEYFELQKEQVGQEIMEMRERNIEKLKNIDERIHNDIAALTQQINAKRTLIDAFQTGIGTFDSACLACLVRYRDANRLAREKPEPSYFKADYSLGLNFNTSDNAERDDRKLEEQTEKKAAVIQSVQDLELSIINQTAESFRNINEVSISQP